MKWMFLSIFLFGLVNVIVKYMGHLPFMELVFFRGLSTGILTVVLMKKRGVSFKGVHWPQLFGRSVSGAVALCMLFYCVQNMPLASAVTLLYLSPIMTIVLAIFMLKENSLPIQWLFFIVAFVGVFLVKGFDPRVSTIELLAGLGAAFFSGMAYNFIRMLRKTDPELRVIFYFNVACILITLPFMPNQWVPPRGMDWVCLAAMGLLTLLAQIYLTRSYQTERADRVSIVNYIGIIYALGFGYFLFGETLSWMSLLGIVLIVLSVAANTLIAAYRKNPI